MRNLLICLLFGIFAFSPQNVKSQQAAQAPWYLVVNLNLGYNFANPSSDFFDTYTNGTSFRRPFYISEEQLPGYEPSDKRSSWGGEIAVKLHNKLYAGILGQRNMRDMTDEFAYTALFTDVDGEIFQFPGVTEQHHFKNDLTHVLAFLDYRIFGKSALSPVIGMGFGFTYSSVEWAWNISGRRVMGNGVLQISGDQTYVEQNNKRNFAFQPRFRLEYSFGGSGFFDAVFVQTDYIFSKYELDFFEDYRNLALEGLPFESLPQALQTDAIRKIYDQYEVDAGGLQVSVGLTLKLAEPD